MFLDISLSGMDGYTARQRLQENPLTKHFPVIAASANVMEHDIKGMGGRYIIKPFAIATIQQSLKQFLQ